MPEQKQMKKIDIVEKLNSFSEHWNPKTIAELNGQHVKVAKLLGEFPWHFHGNEDELFWVIRGKLEIHLRDQMIELSAGEIFVVPKGIEHKPVAQKEVEIVLFEPATTLNTGNIHSDQTKEQLDRI